MPTENRPSNTEQMVSVPEGYMLVERSIWTEQQVEAATACITLLKGVPGMRDRDLAMAAMDAAQCKAPDIALSDLLPAAQHQGEPAWYMIENGLSAVHAKDKAKSERQGFDMRAYCVPLYRHPPTSADAGELERLRAALKFYADREHYHFESGNWDTVSGEPLNILWCGDQPDFIEDGSVARAALSASAEPKSCGACAGCTNGCQLEKDSPPSAPVERDERAAYLAWNNDMDCPLAGMGSSRDIAWRAWQARAALERKP